MTRKLEYNNHDSERADHEEEECERDGNNSDTEIEGTFRNPSDLPPPPLFTPFVHPSPPHTREVKLPPTFPTESIVSGSPNNYFGLFFTESELETLVQNTNAYATQKGAGAPGHRLWRATSIPELKIFLGLIIYMGVFSSPRNPDYWTSNPRWPQHGIGRYMSQNRFEQLNRFFHISPPFETLSRSEWYRKIQPLSCNLSRKFREVFIPTSDIAVDEMTIRFTGRSVHTQRVPGKPIPYGYKILALCKHGYTYNFMLTSRVDSFAELDPNLYRGSLSLSVTSKAVYQLGLSLPYRTYRFTMYMDNYFTNIRLLNALREIGIVACGTARPNSAEYPRQFKFGRKKPCFPHNTISGVVHRNVLSVLWQDNNLVRFLTTVHEITGNPNNHGTNWPLKD